MAKEKINDKAKQQLDSLFKAFSIISDDTHVFLCDMRYDYSRWSSSLVETFGLPSEYMYNAGTIWEEHIHPDDRQAYREGIDAIFSGKAKGHDMQYRAMRPDGEYDICTCRGLVICDDEDNPIFFGGAIRNHSERSQIDTLTGLRNQYGFFADLKSHILSKTPVHIAMGGIRKLTEVNEVYGYQTGNKILQHFGKYLQDHVRDKSKVYRLDGSRFALISTEKCEEQFAFNYDKIREFFRQGINIDGANIILETTAAMLYLEDFNVDDQTVYSCLTFAYQQSKIKNQGDLVIFRNSLNDDNRKSLEKFHVIRAAITHGFEGFYLVYQPVVDSVTEKLLGVEALLRWDNEVYGIIPPDDFIPFIEADPLFPRLGEWIIETALRDAQKLLEYVPDAVVNINLSYSQMEKISFTDTVWEKLRKVGFSPKNLCLEVTERCRLLDMELLRNVIVTLRAGGIKVALDDFGTGFSSIGILKNLPFDTTKIDKSFVMNIEKDEREKQLLNNFTDLAGVFGADVCVEGIETAGMRDIIREYGIHSFQGYYYSKPITIDKLLEKVKDGSYCFAKKDE